MRFEIIVVGKRRKGTGKMAVRNNGSDGIRTTFNNIEKDKRGVRVVLENSEDKIIAEGDDEVGGAGDVGILIGLGGMSESDESVSVVLSGVDSNHDDAGGPEVLTNGIFGPAGKFFDADDFFEFEVESLNTPTHGVKSGEFGGGNVEKVGNEGLNFAGFQHELEHADR